MMAAIQFHRCERALLVLAAVLLVAGSGMLALNVELDEWRVAFERDAEQAVDQVASQLNQGEALVTAVHGLFQGTAELAGAQLPDLANRITRSYPQVRWFAHAEQVPDGEHDAYVRRRRDAGYMGFQVHPLARRATPHAHSRTGHAHLPISHVEPLTPAHARLLGADLYDPGTWRETIQDAIDSAEVRAVAVPGNLLGAPGFVLLRATYLGNVVPDTEAERRAQSAGLVLAFLDAASILGQLSLSDPTARIRFVDPDEGPPAPGTDLDAHAPVQQALSALLYPRRERVARIPVAGLTVALSVSARPRPALEPVFAAMLLTALFSVSGLLALGMRRKARTDEREARLQARLAQVTLHSIGEAVLRLDDAGQVRYMNPEAERMAGTSLDRALGKPLEEVVSLDAQGPVRGADLEALSRHEGPALLRTPSRTVLAVACTITTVTDEGGSATGRVLVMRDVTREHALSRELAWQASHDPLTNLPNRREFERQLKLAIAGVGSGAARHSVCYVDLDQFKIVNDTCGHAAGDRMLRQVAGLLGAELRDVDLLARLGGDEFGILLRDCDQDETMAIAQRICTRVASFRFDCDGRSFELGASIGVVPITPDAGTAHDVQRAADMACYAAKDMGRNRVHLYRHEDHVISRNQREMQWHTELRRALEEGRYELHAQPIHALRGGTSTARLHELLLRLLGEDGELVSPSVFLPAAERYGLMGLVDRMVIEKAFSQVSDDASEQYVFTINLSGQSVSDPGLGDFVRKAAERHGVDPRGVCFEITETAAISNFTQAVALMQGLRREGFRFALDDFGAGVSSFGYLKQLPVDFIKIDGQFVNEINVDPVARVMVSSIISVARVLKIETVAEKVEDEAARRCLVNLGADYVQGYLIGAPAPVGENGVRPLRPALVLTA